MKRTYPYLIALLLTFVFTAAASQLMAQTGPPPPPQSSNTGTTGNAPPVPIDGGIGLLLAAGAAYGIKKTYDMRKKQDDTE